MTTLMLKLEELAKQTKLNYENTLTVQYQTLAQKHGVRLTLGEAKEALVRLGYIND